jgi:hypothetical protein
MIDQRNSTKIKQGLGFLATNLNKTSVAYLLA